MKNWRLWIGIAVSVLSLYLAVRGVDLRGLLEALGQVQYVWLLPAVGLLIFAMLARAYRWRLLFYPLAELRIGRLFNLLNIGYLVNSVSPLRLGDVLRAYLCAELERLKVARVLSTVVVERIVDTLTIVFLLVLLIPFVSLPGNLVRPAFGLGLAAIAAVLVLVFVVSRREQSLAAFDRLAARVVLLELGAFRSSVVSALDGFRVLRSWQSATGAGMWSLAAWLSTAVQFYVVMQAMGLRLPFTAALLVLCLTSLGMAVPSSPGHIGVFEYLTVVSLSSFGLSSETALGYALVLHGLGYLVPVVLGSIAIWMEGYSYARLRDVLARAGSDINST
jgi:uncharacterized protein (TIRG00374 family)